MSKVIKIGISKSVKKKILEVNEVEAIAGKGLINDRYYKSNNDKKCQITLIEIENINNYNKISNTSISALDFRRNIVTEGIRLNILLGSEFKIGEVKVKAHELCTPCKNLQDSLKEKNLIKKLWNTGGLRCEILSSGKIFIGSKIDS